ncbi:TPA: glycosyltransferase family 2 protein [Streptococcus pneumoniae]
MTKKKNTGKILTVVVPSYNAENYLQETMPTILSAKNIERVELLIVNDGSTDRTEEIARQFEREYEGIVRVISKENCGHGSAVNVGIENAVGNYFKVVDADDWVNTNNLEDLIVFLSEVDVDQVLSPYDKIFVNYRGDIEHEEECNEFSQVENEVIYSAEEFYTRIKQTVGMHSITVKTSLLQENNIRLSEKMFYVDMEYIVYMLPYVKKVVLFDKSIYRYRLGTETQSISMASYIKNRDMHKQVIYHLVDFYNQMRSSAVLRRITWKLILNLIRQQWIIYFNLSKKEGKNSECFEFDNWLIKEGRIKKIPLYFFKAVKYIRFKVKYFLGIRK